MHDRGLIAAVARGTRVFYRFGTKTPELEEMVRRLLQLYKERPVTMIKMVYERARNPLQALADVFRNRKAD
jgi:hypothetical protein